MAQWLVVMILPMITRGWPDASIRKLLKGIAVWALRSGPLVPIMWQSRVMFWKQQGDLTPAIARPAERTMIFLTESYKRAGALRFRPQAKVAHHHPERLWRYLKEQYRHGFWRAKLYKEHSNMIGGDDYTRLRDKFEPILVLGITGFSVLVLLGNHELCLASLCYSRGLHVHAALLAS